MNCTNFKTKMTLPLLWETHKYHYETTLTFFELAPLSLFKENKYFVCITYKVLKFVSRMFLLRAIELHFTRKRHSFKLNKRNGRNIILKRIKSDYASTVKLFLDSRHSLLLRLVKDTRTRFYAKSS